MLSVRIKYIMLTAFMLKVVKLNVVIQDVLASCKTFHCHNSFFVRLG
jgi:hypothetical protein